MSDDILDLFAGKKKPTAPKADPGYNAPIELMSKVRKRAVILGYD
jgi:hypothetical protein